MASDDELRRKAVGLIRRKRQFLVHLLVYALVNMLLVVIWAVGNGGFFWPIFPIVGWGILVALNAWSVYYRSDEPSEERIREEMQRMKKDESA